MYNWPWWSFWICYEAGPDNMQPLNLPACCTSSQGTGTQAGGPSSRVLPDVGTLALWPWDQRERGRSSSAYLLLYVFGQYLMCAGSHPVTKPIKKHGKKQGIIPGSRAREQRRYGGNTIQCTTEKKCKFLWEKESHKFINIELVLFRV